MNTKIPRETALITGASAGIGQAFAEVFAEHGFDLVLVARSEDKLNALAEQIHHQHHVDSLVVPLDLTAASGPQRLRDAVNARGVKINVLVNNAGLIAHGRFSDLPLSTHTKMLQLNVLALTKLTHLFLPDMIEQGNGQILNVASVAAFVPLPRITVYAATKAYVLSFTEALAVELKGSHVTVTALCPGPTNTAMMEKWSKVTGNRAELPSFWMMKPYDVAREGYQACRRGKTIHIDGLTNQLITPVLQYSPRWFIRTISDLATRLVK